LQTLYDSNGIKTSFNHDKVEKSVLDRKIVREGANMIARRAVAAVQASAKERSSHYISQPTWTGRKGSAGGGSHPVTPKQERDVVKKEREGPTIAGGVLGKAKMEKAGVSSADILDGLRQLAAIRAVNGGRQSEDATKLGLRQNQANASSSSSSGATANAALDLPIELHESDRKIAEVILSSFFDPKLAGTNRSLTTGQVLEHLASNVAPHHADLFKALLRQMCELTKPTHPAEPGIWTLRREFWPAKRERG